jgi:hypothetical protein
LRWLTVCLQRLVAVARFLRPGSIEAPKPAFHLLGREGAGELPEPVARQVVIGQVTGTAAQVVDVLGLSTRCGHAITLSEAVHWVEVNAGFFGLLLPCIKIGS